MTEGRVGIGDIADRAGVRYNTVLKWRQRYYDFPRPVEYVVATPQWEWAEVEAWLAGRKT